MGTFPGFLGLRYEGPNVKSSGDSRRTLRGHPGVFSGLLKHIATMYGMKEVILGRRFRVPSKGSLLVPLKWAEEVLG